MTISGRERASGGFLDVSYKDVFSLWNSITWQVCTLQDACNTSIKEQNETLLAQEFKIGMFILRDSVNLRQNSIRQLCLCICPVGDSKEQPHSATGRFPRDVPGQMLSARSQRLPVSNTETGPLTSEQDLILRFCQNLQLYSSNEPDRTFYMGTQGHASSTWWNLSTLCTKTDKPRSSSWNQEVWSDPSSAYWPPKLGSFHTLTLLYKSPEVALSVGPPLTHVPRLISVPCSLATFVCHKISLSLTSENNIPSSK